MTPTSENQYKGQTSRNSNLVISISLLIRKLHCICAKSPSEKAVSTQNEHVTHTVIIFTEVKVLLTYLWHLLPEYFFKNQCFTTK